MGFSRVLAMLLIGLLPVWAHAVRLNVRVTTPFVYIQIGHGALGSYGLFGGPASQVDVVSFTFPPGVQPGDGTDVIGTPTIPVAVLGYSGRNRTHFSVTMDSSIALINANGDSLPFDQFSWVTSDGDIPGNTFDNSGQQPLVTLNRRGRRGRGLVDYLTFSYANDILYPSGSYTGRVVYTITEL